MRRRPDKNRKASLPSAHEPSVELPSLEEWTDNEVVSLSQTDKVVALPVNPVIPEKTYEETKGRGHTRKPDEERKERKNAPKVRINSARHMIVAMMTVNGTPKSIIAAVMKMTESALEQEFEFELVNGKTYLDAQVAGQLVKGALKGDFKFVKMYLETKAGYQSADKKPDEGQKDGLTEVERRQLAANLLTKNPELAETLRQQAKKMKKEDVKPKLMN